MEIAKQHLNTVGASRSIENLRIPDLFEKRYYRLPVLLIAQNLTRLRSLDLGHHLSLASARGADSYQQSASNATLSNFSRFLIVAIVGLKQSEDSLLRLERLRLTGFDAYEVSAGGLGVWISFEQLKVLSLESCFGVERALISLVNYSRTEKSTLSLIRLTDLTIRHEDASEIFYEYLYHFLMAFAGLEHLELLLQGRVAMLPECFVSILNRHGESLRCLIFDERQNPRTFSASDASTGPTPAGLSLIGAKCPKLEVLGVSLNWPIITEGHQFDHQVSISIWRTARWSGGI